MINSNTGEMDMRNLQTSDNTMDVKQGLAPLVERLKQLKEIIAQNSYVSHATRKLARLIEDAQSPPMILFIGKERVGKTTLINALLGREILFTSNQHPTAVNTFIRYGKQEQIKAFFLDGMVATFEIENLEMLSISEQFSAQILREHLDYLEVYLDHELLQQVTFIDSTALEVGGNHSAYFSDLLIQRVDELFWVLRYGTTAADPEVHFLEKLNAKGIHPLCVMNGIDDSENMDDFLQAEKEHIGHLMRDWVLVSAKDALEASQFNDPLKWTSSHLELLKKETEDVALHSEKKMRRMLKRLMDWLSHFQKDLAYIPEREPYVSALKSVERYREEEIHSSTRRQRDLAIVAEYEHEYLNISTVFKSVETLYQLLQTVEQHNYLQDEQVNAFVENAINYHQLVRQYRNLYNEYIQEQERLDRQHKKMYGKSLVKAIFRHNVQNDYFQEHVDKLNEQQLECVHLYQNIKAFEVKVLNDLYAVQNHLMYLAKLRLQSVEHKVHELNVQRKREYQHLKAYVAKLGEFDCLIEAQVFICNAIGPYLKNTDLPLTQEELQVIEATITAISEVNLTNNGSSVENGGHVEKEDTSIIVDFEGKYPLFALRLTDADVKSDIPSVPEPLQITYEMS